MHRFLLILFLFPFYSIAQNNPEYLLVQKNDKRFIIHTASDLENYASIAARYGLTAADLITCNPGTIQTETKAGDEIKIPLLSKNFFTWRGIKPGQGMEPVFFELDEDMDKSVLVKKFKLNEETFNTWNPGNVSAFYKGEKVIVGWIKIEDIKTAPVVTQQKKGTPPVLPPTKKNTPAPQLKSKQKEATVSATKEVKPPKENKFKKSVDTSWAKTKAGVNNAGKSTAQFFKKTEQQIASLFKKKKVSEKKEVPEKKVAQKSNSEQKKLTLKDRWNRLVNGKEQPKDKNYSKPLFKKKTASNESTVSTKKNNQHNANTSANTSGAEKKSFQDKVKHQWTDFKKTAKNTFAKKEKKAKPVLASDSMNTSNVVVKKVNTKPAVVKETKTKPLTEKKVISKPKEVKKVEVPVTTKNTKPIPVKKVEEKKVEVPAEKKLIEEPIVKETKTDIQPKVIAKEEKPEVKEESKEIKESASESVNKKETEQTELSLANVKGGKASTFYSGPKGGKFYVVTNLAKRGQTVKVTNLGTGKFVLAEVLGPLPVHDLSKGLILKIGDNAKSQLGISTSNFNVKVNY